jgi:DNA-binding NarL/FixJ family response regulator
MTSDDKPETAKERSIALVVDDSPETLSFLTDTLEQRGITALVARSGQSALTLIERITPDVVLMDAVMPGLDGFETCRQLKQRREFVHIPVIFMTGLSETEHVIKGFDAGGVDYVTKPVAADEILARIRTHLANSRLTQSMRAALDIAGTTLIAVDDAGEVQWMTPRAISRLKAGLGSVDTQAGPWRQAVLPLLKRVLAERSLHEDLPEARGGLWLSFFSKAGPDENLIGVHARAGKSDDVMLRHELHLTDREAEVLLWIARGKANRDIAAILDCSPRTINKHLEQIYSKLGVENRTSAAMIALRTLIDR